MQNRNIRWLFVVALVCAALAVPAASFAQVSVGISVRFGPPPIPVYAQPMCPGPDYIWVPGYWSYGPDGYFWVPGTWVLAPQPGLLWTPGYWGWQAGFYVWHPGYWGRNVGFYGGINYGHGYYGRGYDGGYWRDDHFYYNRRVNRIDPRENRYVYDRDVRVYERSRVSYNGGRGGIDARPTRDQEQWGRERHWEATREQLRHRDEASRNRALWQSENHGRPPIAATRRPGEFRGREASPARGNNRQIERQNRKTRQNNREMKPNKPQRGRENGKNKKKEEERKPHGHPHGRG